MVSYSIKLEIDTGSAFFLQTEGSHRDLTILLVGDGDDSAASKKRCIHESADVLLREKPAWGNRKISLTPGCNNPGIYRVRGPEKSRLT